MKSFTCTNIIKGTNNQVISYELQDSAGKTLQVSSKKLKLMIENNKIAVVNLILKNKEIIADPDYKLKSMLAKLRMFNNVDIKTYKSDCGHKYYVMENSDTTIVYIPDDVEYLIKYNATFDKPYFCDITCDILKVIGGSGLTSTYNMFYHCKAQSIDLSSFDTSKVENMRGMFEGCHAHSIDLSTFNTSNVTDMCRMFDCCNIQSLDLSTFSTSNVTNMHCMFYYCQTESLDLSSFDTSKVTDIHYMFYACRAQSIDLSSFDTSNVTDMDKMFKSCKAQVKATDIKILGKLNNR